jgi:hypothetical protein
MKRLVYALMFIILALSACGPAPSSAPVPTATPAAAPTLAETSTPLPTATPTSVPTPLYPPEGFGPANFPTDVDPLTGMKVADPALLDRRPMVIKVSNLPRDVRPQWGLSLADIVFEYYTEEGTTRYSAIFLGKDASMVGPIRSGRFIDGQLVKGYKAIFAFGYAYVVEMNRFLKSDYADRLVVEGPGAPFTRYDPNGYNHLITNTADLSAYATRKGINGRQDLSGMLFNPSLPAGGQPGAQVYVRYSGAIYNRWDYDPATGTYLRFSDNADAVNGVGSEVYAQLTDRLTNQPVTADNVIFLYVNHEEYSPGILDILLIGSGDAVAFRDGQAYQVKWQRNDNDVVSLTNPDGTPFAFKPGNTFFEVIGLKSTVAQADQSWRFTHLMP